MAAFMQASRTAPADGWLHAMISNLLCDLERFGDAIGAGFMAVECAPGESTSHAALGRALLHGGKPDEGLTSCARAVVMRPDDLGALVTFGAVLSAVGRFSEALGVAQDAVRRDPRHVSARANLALALQALGRIDEAEMHYRTALALVPESGRAQHDLAAILLLQGKLNDESWALYDGRFALSPAARALRDVPRWAGENVRGQTVLLHAEQGFGDVIQFVRYAPMVKARGARIVLAVPGVLVRLLSGMAGVDEVVASDHHRPEHDAFCPLACLPGIFQTRLETIPWSAPYLSADAADARRFAPPPGHLHVGLVWNGNSGFVADRLRSIPSDLFNALADVPGVMFHSLQKDGPSPRWMQNRMGEAADFADTAAMIAGLDLVIAVDTAVAHLAGALGKPVWLLSRAMGCWRWLHNREDSPWYPTLRIFRQRSGTGWEPVLQEVRRALMAQTQSAV